MKRISIMMLVICTCFALAAWPQAKHKITEFNVPGAGTGSGQDSGSQAFRSTSEGMRLLQIANWKRTVAVCLAKGGQRGPRRMLPQMMRKSL